MRFIAVAYVLVFGFVGYLFYGLTRNARPSPTPIPLVAPKPAKAPRHGGCALAERLGPGVKACRDGTVWHRKVDGPEYMGRLDDLAPVLVPAAAG